jgi:hypothetical protein
MCDHCGCREVPPIAELMNEHSALLEHAHHVRHDIGAGEPATANARLAVLIANLERHVQREEDGIFRALRSDGEFVEEIDDLEVEHREFATLIAALDAHSDDFEAKVTHLLDDLAVHVQREDFGIFPVSVVTLGASGWAMVDRAHTDSPSFLLDTPERQQPSHEQESTCRRSH